MTVSYCAQNITAYAGDCGANRVMKLTMLRRAMFAVIVVGVMGFLQDKIERSAGIARGLCQLHKRHIPGYSDVPKIQAHEFKAQISVTVATWQVLVDLPLPGQDCWICAGPSCTAALSEGCTTSMLEPPGRCIRLERSCTRSSASLFGPSAMLAKMMASSSVMTGGARPKARCSARPRKEPKKPTGGDTDTRVPCSLPG